MVIYTKRGDKGETSVYDESLTQKVGVSKDSLRIEVLGAIDEANSYLGICKSKCKSKNLEKVLGKNQRNLLTIGSVIAGSKLRFSSVQTKRLEKLIDEFEASLPVLKNFIVTGGSEAASHLHYARSLVRRAERLVVALSKTEKVKPQILTYLNRLSDAIFMMARWENYKADMKDEMWVGKEK